MYFKRKNEANKAIEAKRNKKTNKKYGKNVFRFVIMVMLSVCFVVFPINGATGLSPIIELFEGVEHQDSEQQVPIIQDGNEEKHNSVMEEQSVANYEAVDDAISEASCEEKSNVTSEVTENGVAIEATSEMANYELEEPVMAEAQTVEEESTLIIEDSPNVEGQKICGNVMNLTPQEELLISKLVWKEARGEKLLGKISVAAVVLNRYNSDRKEFNTASIEAVITQKGAFAPISEVTEADLLEVPECQEAVRLASQGYDPTREFFSDGAFFFYAQDCICSSEERRREGVKKLVIGNHTFHIEIKD